MSETEGNRFFQDEHHREEFDFRRRCYPHPGDIQVFQYADMPPAFRVYPKFDEINRTIRDLDLQDYPAEAFYVRFFQAKDIQIRRDDSSKEYNYAVQAFGIKLPWPEGMDPFVDVQPIPDASKYKKPPIYWYENPLFLVQVWRIRIFNHPLESFQDFLSSILDSRTPPVIYFQERWHPHHHPQRDLCGLEHVRDFQISAISMFLEDCLRIVGEHRTIGRPTNTGEFRDAVSFERAFYAAFQKLYNDLGESPFRIRVAKELGVDRKTLGRYLNKFGIPWPTP